MMKVIRGLHNIKPHQRGCALTIGNFDGIHQGHLALLDHLKDQAIMLDIPTMVMTFEPQPNEFFKHFSPVPRLTRLREKLECFADLGISYVLSVPFNEQIASISADDFTQTILGEKLAPKCLVVGDDFRFGAKRQGTFTILHEFGEERGILVEQMPTFEIDGERGSSTRVRLALEQGNLALAEKLLGRPYSLSGRVAHGDKLGRQIGFPTANIFLHRAGVPVSGVFIVTVEGIDKQPLPGAANVGTRPTVGGTKCVLEVHLLDFDRDIYGQHVKVNFVQRLRDEEKFDTVEAMCQQIERDVEETRVYFNKKEIDFQIFD